MKLQKRIVKKINELLSWKYLHHIIIFIFFLCYTTLSIVKHNHFLSGYDLAIIDQVIWKYSQFKAPISTVVSFFDTPLYYDHVELIFILIAPLYWVFDSPKTLLIFQTIAICSSAFPIFWLTKKYKLERTVSISIVVSYLSFFGFQFSVWSDAHSLLFGVSFITFFVYFLEVKNYKFASLFFILSIISKEDIALLTFLISFVHFLSIRSKWSFAFSLLSVIYLYIVFFIFFQNIVPGGYRFSGSGGLLSNTNPLSLFDTSEKRQTIFYSLAWFGFLPLLSPIRLLPFIGDLAHYFVIGSTSVQRAHGIFMHYRSSVSPLLAWATITAISKHKKLNKWYTGIYILLCAAFFQYYLHLPLSYMTKEWFWTTPSSVGDIKHVLEKLPEDASVATQVNIAPHISHRDKIYTLWPTTRDFDSNSPCGQKNCKWFRVGKTPEYIVVDTSNDWDVRHFLTSKEEFIETIKVLEKGNLIKEEFRSNNAVLYKVTGSLN